MKYQCIKSSIVFGPYSDNMMRRTTALIAGYFYDQKILASKIDAEQWLLDDGVSYAEIGKKYDMCIVIIDSTWKSLLDFVSMAERRKEYCNQFSVSLPMIIILASEHFSYNDVTKYAQKQFKDSDVRVSKHKSDISSIICDYTCCLNKKVCIDQGHITDAFKECCKGLGYNLVIQQGKLYMTWS